MTSASPASKTGQRGKGSFDAVVLLQMGGPATLDEIEPFLRELFADKDIIRLPRWMQPFQPGLAKLISKRRTPKVRPRYEAMGNGSPLQRITIEQATALEKELGVPVHVAMRYTKPRAREAIASLQEARAQRVLLLPLFPHYSISTTQSSLHDFARHAARTKLDAEIHYVRNWGNHPAYLELIETTCRETLAHAASQSSDVPHLLFSAHGVPERYIKEGDTYQSEVEETAARMAQRLSDAFTSVQQGYQSGIGPLKWIQPNTQKLLEILGAKGAKRLVLSPLGFVSDHIETMYDMDTLFAEVAKKSGITSFERVPSFNERPEFTQLLTALVDGPTRPFEVRTWTN